MGFVVLFCKWYFMTIIICLNIKLSAPISIMSRKIILYYLIPNNPSISFIKPKAVKPFLIELFSGIKHVYWKIFQHYQKISNWTVWKFMKDDYIFRPMNAFSNQNLNVLRSFITKSTSNDADLANSLENNQQCRSLTWRKYNSNTHCYGISENTAIVSPALIRPANILGFFRCLPVQISLIKLPKLTYAYTWRLFQWLLALFLHTLAST